MNEEKTVRSLADISASLDKLAISQARTDKEIDKLLRATRHMSNYIDNDARNIEEFFAHAIIANNHNINGIQFDNVQINHPVATPKHRTEYDMLLTNGEYVGLGEVKKRLHRNDVIKLRDKTVPLFRKLRSEYSDRKLLVLACGQSVNSDAREEALESGFWVVTFTARTLQVETPVQPGAADL